MRLARAPRDGRTLVLLRPADGRRWVLEFRWDLPSAPWGRASCRPWAAGLVGSVGPQGCERPWHAGVGDRQLFRGHGW